MKKIILLLVLLGSIFVSCSDDNSDDFPITGLKLPESETAWEAGAEITIEGAGFTTASQIWLNDINDQANRSIQNKSVKAEIKSVSSSSITFIAPQVYGKQNIILNEAGKEYVLGTMTFKAAAEYTKTISQITYEGVSDPTWETHFSYDEKGNVLKIEEKGGNLSTKTTYEYRESEIYSEYWDYNVTEPDVLSFILNKNKLITKLNMTYPNGASYNSEFKYNENNQMIESGNEGSKDIITWTNGDVTKIKNSYSNLEIVFTYTQYENKTNLDLSAYLGDFDAFEDPILMGLGYFGKSNKHLLASYEESYSDGSFGYTYEYTFDQNGYVSTIKEYGKEDKKLRATYTIYYK